MLTIAIVNLLVNQGVEDKTNHDATNKPATQEHSEIYVVQQSA